MQEAQGAQGAQPAHADCRHLQLQTGEGRVGHPFGGAAHEVEEG